MKTRMFAVLVAVALLVGFAPQVAHAQTSSVVFKSVLVSNTPPVTVSNGDYLLLSTDAIANITGDLNGTANYTVNYVTDVTTGKSKLVGKVVIHVTVGPCAGRFVGTFEGDSFFDGVAFFPDTGNIDELDGKAGCNGYKISQAKFFETVDGTFRVGGALLH